MKNTLWLYKDSYQIEIREKEAQPLQVAIYRYKAEEDVRDSGIEGECSRL